MSLINTVLRALEGRDALASSSAAIAPQVRPVKQPVPSGRWVRQLIGLAVIAGFGRVGWILYELRPAQALVTALAFESDAMARTTPVAAPAPPQPAVAPSIATECEPVAEVDTPEAPPPVDGLKLALAIETPIPEKPLVRPSPKRAPSAAPSAANETPGRAEATGAPLLASLPPATVEKRERQRTPAQQAEARFAQAMALMNEGRVAEAESALLEALQADPAHMGARQALVALRLEQRRIDDALPVLKAGLEIDPSQTQFVIVLARIQAERHDYLGALATLNGAKGIEGNPELDNLSAVVLQKLSRDLEAVERYRRALRAAPNNGASWMGLGISLEKLARPTDAAEAYARALASGTLSADARAYVEQRAKELR